MSQEIKPFKVAIPDSELELLQKKLELARLPESLADSTWGEEANGGDGGVTLSLMRDTIKHWKTAYDWRAQEARMNEMPQFTTVVEVKGFDPITAHFVHAKAPASAREGGAIPLLFLHGWPGSFIEVQPMLPLLLEAGFDVVAPSLMGYGFSSYPRQAGFKAVHQAEVFDTVMSRLGYSSYVVQGGDWGSLVGRIVTQYAPERVKALHLNVIFSRNALTRWQSEPEGLSEIEKKGLERLRWYTTTNSAYLQVQTTKPRTFGYLVHDSPVGMLSWMMDKLLLWSDVSVKKWTADEFITWTLLHYLPGPTTAILMYQENVQPLSEGFTTRVNQPVGLSHFANEIGMVPRKWVEEELNFTFWRTHEKGGHFAAYERPAELAADIIEFFNAHWKQ